MSQNPSFSVSIATDLPTDDRDALLQTLHDHADLQESKSRALGPEWIVFVAIMKDVGVIAGAAAAVVKLANEINTWRRNTRQGGAEPNVQLQRPNQPPLNLATATDEEVRAWLENRPDRE